MLYTFLWKLTMDDVNDGTEPIRNHQSLSLNVVFIGTRTVPSSTSSYYNPLILLKQEEPGSAATMPLLYEFTFHEERSLLSLKFTGEVRKEVMRNVTLHSAHCCDVHFNEIKTFHMHFKFLVCCVLYQQFINGGVVNIYDEFLFIWVLGRLGCRSE